MMKGEKIGRMTIHINSPQQDPLSKQVSFVTRVQDKKLQRKISTLPALSIMLHVVDCKYNSWFLLKIKDNRIFKCSAAIFISAP